LKDTDAIDLLSTVFQAVLQQTGIEPEVCPHQSRVIPASRVPVSRPVCCQYLGACHATAGKLWPGLHAAGRQALHLVHDAAVKQRAIISVGF
jgi:hypothetical protein